MSRTSAFLLGALGGFLPILVSLLTVDLAAIIDHHNALTLGNYLGYSIRVIVLLVLGGTVAVLNGEVQQPFSLVQLGIAAPALVTSFINGVPPSNASPPVMHSFFSVVSTANAQEVSEPRRLRVAGGLLGDIVTGIGPGIGTRLDTLNDINKQSQSVIAPTNQAAPNGYNPSTMPNVGSGPSPYPNQLPGNGVANGPPGNFCMTAIGRFGPGPTQPTGSSCFVNTSNGVTYGFITQ